MRLEEEVTEGKQPEKVEMWGSERAAEMKDAGEFCLHVYHTLLPTSLQRDAFPDCSLRIHQPTSHHTQILCIYVNIF